MMFCWFEPPDASEKSWVLVGAEQSSSFVRMTMPR